MSEASALRVLVNAVALRLGGGGSYIVNQARALGELPGLHITVLATGAVVDHLRAACGGSVTVIAVRERAALPRSLYEQCALPLRARGYDVLYQPGGFALFATRRPQVVTNQNPHYFGRSAREFWRDGYPPRIAVERFFGRASLRRADAFVTVSRAYQATVEEDFGRRANVFVLRSAMPRFPAAAEDDVAGAFSRKPYALTVAHDYVHKDWDGLVRAFREHSDLPRLVIVGESRSREREQALRRIVAADGDDPRIVLLGAVADRAQLARLYQRASCFVAHSFLEAGPMTPIEAIVQGAPVAASDIPPHRETCGPHAAYYDPRDLPGLADAVRAAIAGGPPRDAHADVGTWTWEDNARQLATILRSVSGAPAG